MGSLRYAMFRFFVEAGRLFERFCWAIAQGISNDEVRQRWERDLYSRIRPRYFPSGVIEKAALQIWKNAHRARLLDIGAGCGREAQIFQDAGFQVTAVERDLVMAQIGKEVTGDTVRWIVGENWIGELEKASYDLIYLAPFLYGSLPGRKQRIQFLKDLVPLLSAEGCIIIPYSSINRKDGRKVLGLIQWVANVVSILTLQRPKVEYGDRFHSGFFSHSFVDREIVQEIEAAKLVVAGERLVSSHNCHIILASVSAL